MKYALNRKKAAAVLFSIVFALFLLLLSYQAVLFFTELTPFQEKVFLFLDTKGNLPVGFTTDEASHLVDVQKVMVFTNYVFYSLLLLLSLTLNYYRKDKAFLQKVLRYAGIYTVAFIFILLISSFFFFNTIFTIFHQVFFPQGNWIFPADSLLIQTFPLDFFITISKDIFLLSLFFGIIFILLSYYIQHVYRHGN